MNKLNIINEIFNNDCNILDLGDKVGDTGYIDFINPADIKYSIMKGVDGYYRNFLLLKTYFLHDYGEIENNFTVIFQRYSDNKTLYMSCGNYGKIFIHSSGGLDIEQLELINNLIKNKKINLNDDIIDKCRLNSYKNPISLHIKCDN